MGKRSVWSTAIYTAMLLVAMALLGSVFLNSPVLAHEGRQCGVASWYGPGFYGNLTANGERYTGNGMTAAHKTLPFGSRVKVTNQSTGETVIVRINDRGPYVAGRVIDLSSCAANRFKLKDNGVARVCLEVVR